MKVASNIINQVLLTEKGTRLAEEENKYLFRVSLSANKMEIKKAVEELLKVRVIAVNTMRRKGKKKREIHKSLIGSSPSNLIGIDKLSPDRIGKLISMYEHKVFVEGVIWSINSYDQWGVEEAKIQAKKNFAKI